MSPLLVLSLLLSGWSVAASASSLITFGAQFSLGTISAAVANVLVGKLAASGTGTPPIRAGPAVLVVLPEVVLGDSSSVQPPRDSRRGTKLSLKRKESLLKKQAVLNFDDLWT